jgi:hypothetical protein
MCVGDQVDSRRRRKVRCDLGSVDNPHDPPCLRCRREAKECFFSATRRKKKDGSNRDSVSEEPTQDDGYELKTGRKRLRANTLDLEDEDDDDIPRTPGGSIGRTQPLRRPEGPKPLQYGEEDFKASDQMTAILQASEVHSGHDALKVLYEAAVHGRTSSTASTQRPSVNGPSPAAAPFISTASPAVRIPTSASMPAYPTDQSWKAEVEPVTSIDGEAVPEPDPMHVAAALKAWSRYRFVRQGWFTAKEGMAYVEYFYKYCAPLTPVSLPDFRGPEHHPKMLTQEPMLSVTILLTASRHMKLEGPGNQSRPYRPSSLGPGAVWRRLLWSRCRT